MPVNAHTGLKFVSVSGTQTIVDVLVNPTSSKYLIVEVNKFVCFFPTVVLQLFEAFAFSRAMTQYQ